MNTDDKKCGKNVPETMLNSKSLQPNCIEAPDNQQNSVELPTTRKEYMIYQLNNNYPTGLSGAIFSYILILGLAAIVLQVVLIVHKAAQWEICQGIWGGTTCILIAIVNIIHCKNF